MNAPTDQIAIPENISRPAAQFRRSHPDFVLIFRAADCCYVYSPGSDPKRFTSLDVETLTRDFIRAGMKVAICDPVGEGHP